MMSIFSKSRDGAECVMKYKLNNSDSTSHEGKFLTRTE